MKLLQKIFPAVVAILYGNSAWSQSCSSMNLQFHSDILTDCPHMTVTMKYDALSRPYLYVANKESGLRIYDMTNINAPALADSIPVSQLNGLQVMNLSQSGNYLYLATGNHFTNPQLSGMAIVDVTDPLTPVVTDTWTDTGMVGCGIVETEGNYAYVGAMKNGLVILDITDKYNISFMSRIIPDINFPTANPNPDLYNARGMVVKNDIVYLCYDAGGVRIINVSDKNNPAETGRYSNPLLNGWPRAYNNIILDDTLLYVTFDYCGLEVLSVADTSNITQVSWWNPWNCQDYGTLYWFSCPGHANEIVYDTACKLLFISTGKSDLHVVDISNPLQPDSCNYYGGVNNGIGTWGVSRHTDKIFLSYVCAVIPFTSNWTGVKTLTYMSCQTGINEADDNNFFIGQNPADESLVIGHRSLENIYVRIFDSNGRKIFENYFCGEIRINTARWRNGLYFLRLGNEKSTVHRKVVVVH